MNVLAHDGTGAGFWAVVGLVLEEGASPDAVARLGSRDLFGGRAVPPERISLLAARARVRLELADHRAPGELEHARRCGNPVELACVRLALAIDREGPDALDRHADPDRRAVRKAADAVRREFHRLEGLLRFAPVPPRAWLARCEPDHDLVDLLAARLERRFGSDSGGPVPFGVLDLRRRVLAGRGPDGSPFFEHCGDAGAAASRLAPRTPEEMDGSIAPADPDADEELWRAYFAAASNPARANPELQRRFVPGRYRRHLTEFPTERPVPAAGIDEDASVQSARATPGPDGT